MERKSKWFQGVLGLAFLAVWVLPGVSRSEMLVKSSDTSWVSFDMGVRDELSLVQRPSPDSGFAASLGVDSIRPMFSGQLDKYIKFTFNADYSGTTNSLQVLDAIARFEFSDYLNIWVGRLLPPSDRSNLSGPYYLNSWNFDNPTGVLDPYPFIFAGRDDGIAYWGQAGGGVFKWQLGAFEGFQGPFNPDKSFVYSARLTLNVLDPDPGYYNSSTYLGKDILALGLVGMVQPYAPGYKDYVACNADLLFEKKMDAGTLDLEGAYYKSDETSAIAATNIPPAFEGDGYFVLGSFLVDKIQPNIRWMAFTPTGGVEQDTLDAGLAYYLAGYSKLIVNYDYYTAAGSGTSTSMIQLGTQLIY
jgi:hypothetical protein